MNLLLSLHPVDKERVPRARDSLRSLALGLERGRGFGWPTSSPSSLGEGYANTPKSNDSQFVDEEPSCADPAHSARIGISKNSIKILKNEKQVARTSVLILAPWNPLSLCPYGESHKEFN